LRKTASPEKTAVFKAAFDDFRKEAVQHKAAVKRNEASLGEFSVWLLTQQDEADRLMSE